MLNSTSISAIMSRRLCTTMRTNNNRELDINNLLHNGKSPIATRLTGNTTDEASLPPNIVITPPCAINNRATNYTSVDKLKVQNDKSGLIRDYQKCAYTHILHELFGNSTHNETLVALDEYGITSLPKLLELIRTPGSIVGLRYNGEMLREDQYSNYSHYIHTSIGCKWYMGLLLMAYLISSEHHAVILIGLFGRYMM